MNAMESVANFVAGMRYEEIPPQVVSAAKRAVIDCLGVSLAATAEPSLAILRSFITAMGGEPRSTLLATKARTSPAWAALYNGTLAHVLDFDDGSGLKTPLHPTVPVLPAAIALGELFGASGAQVLEAFICGTEVECKLTRGCTRASYDAGWHATGVFGTMGAAAAASRLAGLDPARVANAMGTALSLVGGSRQNFGTMVKSLHAGMAAMNGVVSALLAKDGFTASEEALDGPFGFGALFGGKNLAEECSTLGKPYHLASGFSIKKYPSCYATHSALDAALDILRTHQLDYREIKQVDCWVHPSHISGLPYKAPETPLEGKFSMSFTLALACVYGSVQLGHFTDQVVRDRRIVEMCEKVTMLPDTGLPLMGSRVKIVSARGDLYEASVDWARGNPTNPLTAEEVNDKFRSCARLLLSPDKADHVLGMLLRLEELDTIASLTEAIADW